MRWIISDVTRAITDSDGIEILCRVRLETYDAASLGGGGRGGRGGLGSSGEEGWSKLADLPRANASCKRQDLPTIPDKMAVVEMDEGAVTWKGGEEEEKEFARR